MPVNVTFSNVSSTCFLRYDCVLGTRPGAWTMMAIPQATAINPLGSLVFTDGFRAVTLTDCQVSSVQVVFGVNGPRLSIRGTDRRWRWQGKAIDGRYNVRRADGTIIPETERTPRELASLLWEAMGEPTADAQNLPNEDRPEVNWECTEAAPELDQLCSLYGCAPALQISNDTVSIFRIGTGSNLPDNTFIRWTQFTTSGVLPGRIDACSGHAVWQSKFKIEPILQDTDGTWKLADDVEYAPEDGWDGSVSDPSEALQPDNPNWSAENEEKASLLWRMWIVTTFADGTLAVPGYQTVPNRWHVLPLFSKLLLEDVEEFGDSGQDAFLIGSGRPTHDPDEPTDNLPDGSLMEVSFNLDGKLGIVKTSVPIVKVDEDFLNSTPDLYLVCSHLVRAPDTFQFVRHIRVQNIGGPGGVVTVDRKDISRLVRSVYDTGENHTETVELVDNEIGVNQVLDDAISQKLSEIGPHSGVIREYNGVQLIPMSGTVRHLGFELDCELKRQGISGDRNCVTIASQNVEGGPVLYDLARRRLTQSDADQSARLLRRSVEAKLFRKGDDQ